MKVYSDISLSDFEWWSGAKSNAELLDDDQFDQLESILEECYPDGMTDTQINDLMCFDFEWVCEMLGIDDPYNEDDEDEDEEDDDTENGEQ